MSTGTHCSAHDHPYAAIMIILDNDLADAIQAERRAVAARERRRAADRDGIPDRTRTLFVDGVDRRLRQAVARLVAILSRHCSRPILDISTTASDR
jgi:hypothetical protein